jgi:uncharacterized coiled-coil protein SlyX
MSDGNKAAAGLRERLTIGTEDKIGRALVDLIENPLITGTIGRAFDARERAAQAQELALSALNIPTAADIERLTRRLRSVSQRLEGIEDGVHRINRALTEGSIERRLAGMEEQLKALSNKLSATGMSSPERTSPQATPPGARGASAKPPGARGASAKPPGARGASAKPPGARGASAKPPGARGASAKPPRARAASAKASTSAGSSVAAKKPAKRTAPKRSAKPKKSV